MSRAEPVFSVIVPVFNKWELTENCLRSLQRHTPEYSYEVIVVDNGSTDATTSELEPLGKSLFGGSFRCVRFAENKNFGPGCNAGADAATAPFLFFLNNDTVLTPHWAPPLLREFDNSPPPGAVGPLLLYENNTVQHVGVAFSVFHVLHLYRQFPAKHPVIRKKRTVRALTAAALFMPRDLFLQSGGYYEGYRNGFEDVDLCLRLGQLGKTLICVPDSVIYHLESMTPGRKDNEGHNRSLLRGRCENLFRADLHVHGLRDGFVPCLGDDFDLALSMTEEQEAALFRKAQSRPPEVWQRLMSENPLWYSGREHIAKIAERQKHWSFALSLHLELAYRRVRVKDYISALATAELAGDASALKAARSTLEYLSGAKEDSGRALHGLRLAAQWNDSILNELYTAKARELCIGQRLNVP